MLPTSPAEVVAGMDLVAGDFVDGGVVTGGCGFLPVDVEIFRASCLDLADLEVGRDDPRARSDSLPPWCCDLSLPLRELAADLVLSSLEVSPTADRLEFDRTTRFLSLRRITRPFRRASASSSARFFLASASAFAFSARSISSRAASSAAALAAAAARAASAAAIRARSSSAAFAAAASAAAFFAAASASRRACSAAVRSAIARSSAAFASARARASSSARLFSSAACAAASARAVSSA